MYVFVLLLNVFSGEFNLSILLQLFFSHWYFLFTNLNKLVKFKLDLLTCALLSHGSVMLNVVYQLSARPN